PLDTRRFLLQQREGQVLDHRLNDGGCVEGEFHVHHRAAPAYATWLLDIVQPPHPHCEDGVNESARGRLEVSRRVVSRQSIERWPETVSHRARPVRHGESRIGCVPLKTCGTI